MTNEEIYELYLYTSGKAEGISEVKGEADFPVLFANAVLKYERAKRKWVGLTKKEELQIEREFFGKPFGMIGAVEAKLKEKNT